jgi:hypothetical protein
VTAVVLAICGFRDAVYEDVTETQRYLAVWHETQLILQREKRATERKP